jgi:hypothetical protein
MTATHAQYPEVAKQDRDATAYESARDMLGGTISALEVALDNHEQRIHRILDPASPPHEVPDIQPETPTSEVVGQLGTFAGQVRVLTVRVQVLTERVEL